MFIAEDAGIHKLFAERVLERVSGVEMWLHGTVLYNSTYRADDQLLVNTNIYGVMANMASTYIDSFNRVWDLATPCESR
jgi:hypothetical protein